jgi:hypothetical protein
VLLSGAVASSLSALAVGDTSARVGDSFAAAGEDGWPRLDPPGPRDGVWTVRRTRGNAGMDPRDMSPFTHSPVPIGTEEQRRWEHKRITTAESPTQLFAETAVPRPSAVRIPAEVRSNALATVGLFSQRTALVATKDRTLR